jgi:MurNAc alpha-1-phosphate uridylyltransferase
MKTIPEQAFILAAGKGTRMRPVTDAIPKPMVRVAGKPIIDYALDKLAAIGVKRVIVNLHYLGDVLEEHLAGRKAPEIILSKEEEILETGGGVKNALPLMQNEPLFLINGDALWSDGGGENTLLRLAKEFEPDRMDMLLLLQKLEDMCAGQASGDYDLLDNGRTVRPRDKSGSLMFTGIRIVSPDALVNLPDGAFSFLEAMDRSEKNGRLYGLVNEGRWYHISTPQDLEEMNRKIASGEAVI